MKITASCAALQPGKTPQGGTPPPRRAFTLIELLVVIAIIALLVSILLPSLSRARELARMVVCMAHIRAFSNGLATYTNANTGYLPGPNTSGLPLADPSNWSSDADCFDWIGKSVHHPIQDSDWISPTVGKALGLPLDPSARLEAMLNQDLRCPSNDLRYGVGGEYSGGTSNTNKPNFSYPLPGTPEQFYVMSYSAGDAFLKRRGISPSGGGRQADRWRDKGVDPDDDGYSGGQSDGNMLGTLDIYPSNYEFKDESIRHPDSKCFVSEGVRYGVVNSATFGVTPATGYLRTGFTTYNGMVWEGYGGNFMHGGWIYDGGGNPYKWTADINGTSTTSTDGQSSKWMKEHLSYGSRKNGFRHLDLSINMLFFDGHVSNMSMAEAVNINLHVPSDVKIYNATETPDPNDQDGQVVE